MTTDTEQDPGAAASRPEACVSADVDPDWFVPSVGDETVEMNNRALMVCAVCPVRDECLTTARDNGEEFGVWGGMVLGSSQDVAAALRCSGESGDPRHQLLARAVRGVARDVFERVRDRPASRRKEDLADLRKVEAALRRVVAAGDLVDEAALGPAVLSDDGRTPASEAVGRFPADADAMADAA